MTTPVLSVMPKLADDGVDVLVRVEPPELAQRTPSDICCVVDISGSMGNNATITNEAGQTESHGLTLLDVAKHGVRSVLKTLGASDRLSIVVFDNYVETKLPLTFMDEAGQTKAGEVLDGMQDRGGTDIWKGLYEGLEVLRKGFDPDAGRLAHIMLLTDGQTMRRDQVMPSLKQYEQEHERLPGTVSTFGFGYSIDSPLLVEMAQAGAGIYSFIPDAGFVGTIFVNTLSMLLVTMAREVYLNLGPEEGAEIIEVKGCRRITDTAEGGKRVALDSMQGGQSCDVVLKMKVANEDACFLTAKVQYEGVGCKAGESMETNLAEGKLPGTEAQATLVEIQRLRCLVVDTLHTAMSQNLEAAQSTLSSAVEAIAGSPAKDDEAVTKLLEDLSGQATEAFSKSEYFNKWGKHYVPSLRFAHGLQVCNNFKDPGVQVYGGKLFKEIQDQADDIFNSLPAPTPSGSSYVGGGGGVSSMAAYNSAYAPCIDGASRALLGNGKELPVGEVKAGDRVAAPGGAVATVACVVRSAMAGRAALAKVSEGLRLTPFHPIQIDGQWRFPADVALVEEADCEAVYSFVLEGAPALLIDGVPVVALGHGIEEGAAKHPYLSTQRVVQDLAHFPGFGDGFVQMPRDWAVRDPVSGLVVGLRLP